MVFEGLLLDEVDGLFPRGNIDSVVSRVMYESMGGSSTEKGQCTNAL